MQAEDAGESSPAPQDAPAGSRQAPAQQASPTSNPPAPSKNAQADKVQVAASVPEDAAAGSAQQAGLPGMPITAPAAAAEQHQPSKADRGEHAGAGDRSKQMSPAQQGTPAASTGVAGRPRSALGNSGGTKRSADGGRPVLAPPPSSAQHGSQAKRLKVAETPAPQQQQQMQPGSNPQAAARQGSSAEVTQGCSGKDAADMQDAGNGEAADDMEVDRGEPILTATQMTVVTRTQPEGPDSCAVSSRPPKVVDASELVPAQGLSLEPVQHTVPDQAPAGRSAPAQQPSRQATGRHAGSQDSVQSSPTPAATAHADKTGSRRASGAVLNPGGTTKKSPAYSSSKAEDDDADEPVGEAGAGPSSPQWHQRKRVAAAGEGGHTPAAGVPPSQAAAAEEQPGAEEEGAAGHADGSEDQVGAQPEQAQPAHPCMPSPPLALEGVCKGMWKPRVQRGSGLPGASMPPSPYLNRT